METESFRKTKNIRECSKFRTEMAYDTHLHNYRKKPNLNKSQKAIAQQLNIFRSRTNNY